MGDTKPKRQPLSIITLVNFTVCLLTIILTGIFMGRTTIDNSQPPVELLPETCIDCAHLNGKFLTLPEASGFKKRHENGAEMCCAENQEQMSALLQAIIKEQAADSDARPEASGSNSGPVVSAHKRILSGYTNETALEAPYFNGGIQHFETNFSRENDPVTEHANGVDILDSALKIKSTGLYYVYISIHTDSKFNMPAKNFTYQSVFEYVFRKSPNNPQNSGILLQMAYTAHEDSVKFEETDYRGGTFHLIEGDTLLVCVTCVGLFRYNRESSFLGLILLNSE